VSIIAELVQYVNNHPALAAVQVSRFYPIQLPQRPTLPASTYQIVSNMPGYSQDGLSYEAPRVQIDCYAKTYAEAHTLADAFLAALAGWHAAFGIPAFIASGPYDLPDDPELERSRVSFDVSFGE